MGEVKTNIRLLSMTPRPGEVIEEIASISYQTQRFFVEKHPELVRFASGRTVPMSELSSRYSPEDFEIGKTLPGYAKDDVRIAEIIPASYKRVVKFVLAIGHHSLLRNLSATFMLENITRKAALHILRYEFCHFNMQSQKYQPQDQFNYLLPDDVELWKRKRIANYMVQSQIAYQELSSIGLDPEWSRVPYPNNIAQTMSITTNFEQWRHLFDCLCNDDYVSENRDIMLECFRQLSAAAPEFFHDYRWDDSGKFLRRLGSKYARNKKVNWTLPVSAKKEFGLFVPKDVPGEEIDIP